VIKTVTLNPALDKTLVIEDFAVDRVNRALASGVDAGGKGINVSKALAILGGRSVAYGIACGDTGDYILGYLADHGIEARFVRSSGRTRTNLKIVDPVGKTHTDINEAGPRVDAKALEELEETLFADASPEDIFVFSGSAPEGCGPGIYERWIKRAARAGARSVLDADGELLLRGARAEPDLMKPNERELERLAGRSLPDNSSRVAAVRALLGGKGIAAVSLGAEGALFVDAARAIRAEGIAVKAASTVGAGDTMLAAIVLCMEKGSGLEEMVVPAVAAGTAAVEAGGSAAFAPAAVKARLGQVRYADI
jgi:1-phosphofructokinase